MREQPIDPQAEQEMIDSIEELYYSNDSFDMVQHELEVRYSLYEPESTSVIDGLHTTNPIKVIQITNIAFVI